MTAPLNPKFPLTTEDYAEIGEALVRAYVVRGILGHNTASDTCIDYIARDELDNDGARFVWDVLVATKPYNNDNTTEARQRLADWTIASGAMHKLAEHISQ